MGSHYPVIVTTGGGLYRYQMMDQVQVVGFNEQAPLLQFAGKCDATSDLVGEKLCAAHVQAVVDRVMESHALSPCFLQLVAHRSGPPHYVLRVADHALEGNMQLIERIREMIDRGLSSNPAYRYAQDLGQLGRLQVELITPTHGKVLEDERMSNLLRSGFRHGDIKPEVLSPSRTP